MTGSCWEVKGTLGGLEKEAGAQKVVVEPVKNGREGGTRALEDDVIDVEPVAPPVTGCKPACGVNQPQRVADDKAKERVGFNAALDQAATDSKGSPTVNCSLHVDKRASKGPYYPEGGCKARGVDGGGFEGLFPSDRPKRVFDVERGEDAVRIRFGGSSHLSDFVPRSVLATGAELVRSNALLYLTQGAADDNSHRKLQQAFGAEDRSDSLLDGASSRMAVPRQQSKMTRPTG